MNLALIGAKIHIVRLVLKLVASSPKRLSTEVNICFPLLCPPHWRRQYPLDRPLLPCRPPASTLQVDVNGDAERPPGGRCAQEHGPSSTGPLLVQIPLVHLVSGSRPVDGGSRPPTAWTRLRCAHLGTPRCLPRLKGECASAFRPAARCHGNRPAGEAGRMLISSRRTAGASAATCCPSKSLFNDLHLMLHTRAHVPVTLKAPPLPHPPPPHPHFIPFIQPSCRGGRC